MHDPRLPPLVAPGPLRIPTKLDPVTRRRGQAPSGPQGLAAFLARPGLREALLATGSALLAQSDSPGTLGGALGRALPMGAQALQRGRQEAEIDALIEGAPPEMQQLLRALPASERVPALLGLQRGPDPVKLGAGERLVDPGSGAEVVGAVPEPEEAPAKAQEFAFFESLTPEQRELYAQMEAAGRGPLVTVDTGGRAASAASQALGGSAAERLVSGATSAESSLGMVENITQAERLLDDPAMEGVTGPGSSIKTVLSRFGDDPRARELAAQFDILTSDLVLQTIQSFKGSLSDKELQFIERASASDRNMTVDELTAGLGLLRRIAERNIEGFVSEVEGFNPEAFDVTEAQMRQYRNLAERARGALSGGGGAGGADPLRLR